MCMFGSLVKGVSRARCSPRGHFRCAPGVLLCEDASVAFVAENTRKHTKRRTHTHTHTHGHAIQCAASHGRRRRFLALAFSESKREGALCACVRVCVCRPTVLMTFFFVVCLFIWSRCTTRRCYFLSRCSAWCGVAPAVAVAERANQTFPNVAHIVPKTVTTEKADERGGTACCCCCCCCWCRERSLLLRWPRRRLGETDSSRGAEPSASAPRGGGDVAAAAVAGVALSLFQRPFWRESCPDQRVPHG